MFNAQYRPCVRIRARSGEGSEQGVRLRTHARPDGAVAPEGFNVDPLCNCQDPAGLTIRDLTVTETGPDSADAAITTLQGDAQVSQVLKLVREEGSWRIDNITREGDPAFRDELAQWTAEAQG